jgi:vancomycin resistance protein VanJ
MGLLCIEQAASALRFTLVDHDELIRKGAETMRNGYYPVLMKNLRKLIRLSTVIGIYSILIFLWYLSWLMIGDRNWWLVILNRFTAYLFVPGLFLLVAAILMRRPKILLPLLLPALIFILLYYPYLLPKSAKPADEARLLRVMTYNVLYSNEEYDAVSNVILTHGPDLVALQEVVPELMSALVERLKDDYPYYVAGTYKDFGETAVFSRYPIVDSQVIDVLVDRRAVVVKVAIREQDVTFVSIHLMAYNLWWTKVKDVPATIMERTRIQHHQVEIVFDQVDDEDGIVLIGCDCNAYETSSTYQMVDQYLDNAAREVGLLWTGNESSGAKQDVSLDHIDYVWYRGDIEPIRVYKLLDSGGSDHLPVLVTFRWK